MKTHEQIQYIEFLSNDLEQIKRFYKNAFNWKFTDFGPEYTAFEGKYIEGGFTVGVPVKGSILPIIYSEKLEETLGKVKFAKGKIVKEIFDFPGGRRFHFADIDGNELAVWSDKNSEGIQIDL
ncbi:VOC family protein [Galbibacter sp. EGI 63066]|uniref:VOC family protein n=1 Tax=Galbibacter sp. EGI 63066 TaxID=2993559 RepID=UPI00224983CB|nr:VOC family protein [Galbibacter sp. EGI 63066]MCX2681322.1 VOC family protein [Galbibacter sp. EGI 63066]